LPSLMWWYCLGADALSREGTKVAAEVEGGLDLNFRAACTSQTTHILCSWRPLGPGSRCARSIHKLKCPVLLWRLRVLHSALPSHSTERVSSVFFLYTQQKCLLMCCGSDQVWATGFLISWRATPLQ